MIFDWVSNVWNPAFAKGFGGQTGATGFQTFFQGLDPIPEMEVNGGGIPCS